MKKCFVLLFCVVGLAIGQVANAATITYDLQSDHCTGLCGPQASFGTILLTDVTGGVQITVTLLNGNRFTETGFDGTIGFNLIGNPTITESPDTVGWRLNGDPAGSPITPVSAQSLTNWDGFGTFEYGIICDACAGSATVAGPLTFTVLGTGLDITDFAELSTGKGGTAAFFAVDILSGTTGKTGLVDATSTVPDGGATVTLLGSVLLGLGMLRRRFGKT
jgi:hypothetical protein